jgi:hypothetical protein
VIYHDQGVWTSKDAHPGTLAITSLEGTTLRGLFAVKVASPTGATRELTGAFALPLKAD